MNDAAVEEQKVRVMGFIDLWLVPLGLGMWNITHKWNRGEHAESNQADRVVMTCTAWWQYLSAALEYFLPAVAARDDEDLEECIVHELIHMHLSEMRSTGLDHEHEERVATQLSRAFLWVRNAAAK